MDDPGRGRNGDRCFSGRDGVLRYGGLIAEGACEGGGKGRGSRQVVGQVWRVPWDCAGCLNAMPR